MPTLNKYQVRRIEDLRRGAEAAPAKGYISIKAADMVWLIGLIDYQPEPDEPERTFEDLQGPAGENLGDLD